jgi:hypothetical protein
MMNDRIEHCLYQAGLTAQGCWDELDDYAKQGIEKFAELLVRECADLYTHDDVMAPVGQSAWGEAYQDGWIEGTKSYRETILEHFGLTE